MKRIVIDVPTGTVNIHIEEPENEPDIEQIQTLQYSLNNNAEYEIKTTRNEDTITITPTSEKKEESKSIQHFDSYIEGLEYLLKMGHINEDQILASDLLEIQHRSKD